MTRRLGLRLLAVVGAVVFAACAPAREYSLEEAPQSAYFLLFPSSQAKAYRSPDTRPGEELVDVRRAVTVSRDELRAGVIRFLVDATTDGYARVTDFSPLPQGDPVQQIADWEVTLPWQGYSSGGWEERAIGGGLHRIRFGLTDGRHARWNTFEYTTDGREILRVLAPRTFSWADTLAVTILALATFVALGLGIVAWRVIRRMWTH